MKEYCIYFNIHIDKQHNIYYYAMLYHALETLFQYYDGSFDIVVFQSFIDELNFNDYSYLSKYNIVKDFKNIRIIKSEYKEKYKNQEYNDQVHSPWMSKWYNLQKVYEMGYKKVFMIDCDVVFFGNPSYIFSKYSSDYVWVLGCADDVFSSIYKDKHPIMSGQVLIDFDRIHLPLDFYEKCIEERLKQRSLASALEYKFGTRAIKNFTFFNEQYSAQIVLENLGSIYNYLEPCDFTTPANCNLENKAGTHVYEVKCRNDNIYIENIKTCIIHYAAGCVGYNLPEYLRDNHLNISYKNWIKQICN